jgi:hypothetical protein
MKRTTITIIILVGLFSFSGGYWLNEYLNQRYYRNESMRLFIRALQVGQEKGYITVHYEKMNGMGGIKE